MNLPDAVRMPVGEIVVGDRVRRDPGDIDALAESIGRVGILHPLVLNTRKELVAGFRRLMAVRKLGWEVVPCRRIERLDDALSAMLAEQQENTCREALSPLDLVEFGRRIEELERPKSRDRELAGHNQHTEPSGKFPQGSTGRVRDKVGEAVGVSGRTYEKAKQVVEAAEKEPEKFGDLPAKMEAVSIHAAHQELKARQDPEPDPEPELDEFDDEEDAPPAPDPLDAGQSLEEFAAAASKPADRPPVRRPVNRPAIDPDHPHAELLKAITAFAVKVSQAVNAAEHDSKLRAYLLNVGFVFPRAKIVGDRKYKWQCVGLRGLYRVVKLAGLPGKPKAKDRLVKMYDEANDPANDPANRRAA